MVLIQHIFKHILPVVLTPPLASILILIRIKIMHHPLSIQLTPMSLIPMISITIQHTLPARPSNLPQMLIRKLRSPLS